MLIQKELFSTLKTIIVPFMDPQDEACFEALEEKKANAEFKDDLGIDSIDIVEIVIEIETEFDMHFENEDIENIVMIKDAINVILSKRDLKAA